ncbi:catechol 1,2-dioxygenase [Paucimonas lemoignei]|uniref:Catechol 1,2-dioxygenase n=1 Tax=Paucimonas lemoignei TaxID=29443 RepID=A0A4R3HW43_PAULE|nr:dioxygenase [Paucimonas lemoignei]TCS37362.1 catechol 1,2-dioxygenase [Paucimonas lemoignei]
MKNEFTREELLNRVNTARVAPGNERVRALSQRIISDLFKTIDELKVTPDEFWAATQWLSRLGASGQIGLITAGLGFDRLLDILQDEADKKAGLEGGTPRAIEGPLYVPGAPSSKYEARLDDGTMQGETYVMEGVVRGIDGKPLANASLDAWHANEHGMYSHFDPSQKPYNLRRNIITDEQGRYRFRSVIPPGYAIPPTGPVAELFAALGRHGHRPAHIHFLVSAPGMRTLTTQVNIPGDTYIDDDFAFATRDGLVVSLEKVESAKGYESLGIEGPFTRIPFDFVLQVAHDEKESKHLSRIERIDA